MGAHCIGRSSRRPPALLRPCWRPSSEGRQSAKMQMEGQLAGTQAVVVAAAILLARCLN